MAAKAKKPESQGSESTDARRIVETILRPLIEADGGSIQLIESEDDHIAVELGGNCLGCPGANYTIHSVIHRALDHLVTKDRKVKILWQKPPAKKSSGRPSLPIDR